MEILGNWVNAKQVKKETTENSEKVGIHNGISVIKSQPTHTTVQSDNSILNFFNRIKNTFHKSNVSSLSDSSTKASLLSSNQNDTNYTAIDLTPVKSDIAALENADINVFLDTLENKNPTILETVFSSLDNEVFLSLLEVFENKISNIVLTKKQSESTCYLCGLMIEHLVKYNQAVSNKLYEILTYIAKSNGDIIADDLKKYFNNNKQYLQRYFKQADAKDAITNNYLNLLEKLTQYHPKNVHVIFLIDCTFYVIIKSINKDKDNSEKKYEGFTEYLYRIASNMDKTLAPKQFISRFIKKNKVSGNLLSFVISQIGSLNLQAHKEKIETRIVPLENKQESESLVHTPASFLETAV